MKNEQLHNVLVIRLSALGDVAMTIPAIYSVARTYPGTVFHVVTTTFCAQLFVNAPQNVVLRPVETPVTTWHVLRQVSRLPVDAVADLHNVLRSWVVDAMFLLRGKPVSMLNKHRQERRAILKRGKVTTSPFVYRYFDVFTALGLPCKPCFDTVFSVQPPLPIDIKKGGWYWIGIAPFARYQNKTYPINKMQEVVRLLAAQLDVHIFLFGSHGQQAAMLSHWESLSPRIHCVAGRYTLYEELSLMAHLDLMLSMDSANMHLASIVSTRVVSVWGSTTPACGFYGWGWRQDDAICLNLDCQPCTIGGSHSCRIGGLNCLRGISPETIVQRVINSLKLR